MKNILWIGIIATITAACGQGFQIQMASNASETAAVNPTLPVDPATPIPAPHPEAGLGICSKLDFENVIWPSSFHTIEKRSMALALNITGSYEGTAGWENLANNFDGQGFSLGLNQQNLGQGTLQPILKVMFDRENSLARATFSKANLDSITAMVNTWSQNGLVEDQAVDAFGNSMGDELYSNRAALSKLDIGYEPEVSMLASRNSVSVSWAVSTVYQSDKTTFKPEWRKSLQTFASTAPYRSLQVQAAATMFDRAVAYFFDLRFNQMRSLLLMYDFVVQNGGFNSDHLASFRKFDAANPNASEGTRLLKLLEIRLVSVRPEFRADVDARKKAIIYGTGRVHGRARDLPKEYCFQATAVVRAGSDFIQP